MRMIQAKRVIVLVTTALLLAACAGTRAPKCDTSQARAYEARDIGQEWIDYVWVELPDVPVGSPATGRLFVASADPVGAIVPTMIDLLCAAAPVEYAPAEVTFDVDASGIMKTSYPWGSCAKCSECYMKWTFSLDVTAQQGPEGMLADLVLNETFHSGPMKIVTVKMKDVTSACTEPRLTCAPDGTCGAIRYEGRK